MKNYFDNLIYKSIKKIQYIKINEKLNSLQNLYEMGKYFNNINNNNITNINNSSYQEEINIENNGEINTNNINNNNINTNLNNNIIEEKEKEWSSVCNKNDIKRKNKSIETFYSRG